MTGRKYQNLAARLIMTIVLWSIVFAAIGFMYTNVLRDLRLLNSARSDNLQWTLSQVEVDFINFELALDARIKLLELKTDYDASAAPIVTEFSAVRHKFDIIYSRINLFSEASSFESVRKSPEFSANLEVVASFLKDSINVIDASESVLASALLDLAREAKDVRGNVRKLSLSGMVFFANDAVQLREALSETLMQMTVGVTALILALLVLAVYLYNLSLQNLLRKSEAQEASVRMNAVISTALDAVVVYSLDGSILDFNDAAEHIFGHTALDAIGRDLGMLIVPDYDRSEFEVDMQRMRDVGENRIVGTGRFNLNGKRANGEVFPLECSIQSALAEEGEFFIAFFRDISRRVGVEKALVSARDIALAREKEKTRFLVTMNHEIRTPLNGLLGSLTLLSETKLSATQANYIKSMNISGKLLMSDISDVLDIAQFDTGKVTLRPVAMNLSELLQDIIDSLNGTAFLNSTKLEWGWSGVKIDWIHADRDRIQHALMNVIGNAVKFTKLGRVSVNVSVIGDQTTCPFIQFTIRDNGIGMSENLREQVFDDFMTGDISYGRAVSGTGLGLGIAQRIVKTLSGTIDVESKEMQGSTFIIRFPITPIQEPKKVSHTAEIIRSVQKRHILLVEDNEINRSVVREMLVAEGHTVTEAINGQIAVELSQNQHFDLILMDVSMPVMDGRTATRTIRASYGPSALAPIVALTANTMAKEREAFLSDGMNEVLSKPLSRQDLLNVIDHYAERDDIDLPQDQGSGASLVVDLQYMKDLREVMDTTACQSWLSSFCAEVDKALVYITNEEPIGEISSHAHKVAGSAAVFGAIHLREVLIEIENAARQQDIDGVAEAVAALTEVWAKTLPLLVVAASKN